MSDVPDRSTVTPEQIEHFIHTACKQLGTECCQTYVIELRAYLRAYSPDWRTTVPSDGWNALVSHQMKYAPSCSVYLCATNTCDDERRLAQSVSRGDLRVVPRDWLVSKTWRLREFMNVDNQDIVMDYRIQLTPAEYRQLELITASKFVPWRDPLVTHKDDDSEDEDEWANERKDSHE